MFARELREKAVVNQTHTYCKAVDKTCRTTLYLERLQQRV